MPTNARVNVQKDNVTDALSSSVVVPTGEALTIASGGYLTAEAGSIVNIPASGITGLGTMATQNANAVAITGGSITGITDLAIADGGTGASNAPDARTNLGLGSLATQNANAVAITGGSITGITDLAVADGGTGTSSLTGYVKGAGTTPLTASSTIPNTDITGLGTMSTQNASSVAITGGSITGITDLAVADGGTGASNAADARVNLGVSTTGTSILYGNGAGSFSNVTIGSGVSFTGGTLSATGTGGTVTTVSVTSANGVSGTVANPTTTPAISLSLGNITPTTVNSVTLSGSATPTLAVTGTSTISGTNTGDQTISITGDVTAAGSQNTLTSTVTKINGQALATLSTGILKNTTTTGVPSIAVAADFPTLNQNTSGNAATATNVAVTGVTGLGTGVASFLQTPTSANLSSMVVDETGSGNLVFANSPVLITPHLDTPSVLTLTNATGLPLSTGVIGTLPVANGGTGVTSSTGTGSTVLSASPTFTGTPAAPTAAVGTNTTQIATTQYVQSNRGDKYLTTSTSTNTIDNGNGKVFNCAIDLSYIPTQAVTIVYNINNHMHATVITYNILTGVMVVDVDSHTGSGTYSAWTINLGGLTSAGGALLSANNLSDVASVSTSRINLGVTATGQDTTYLYRANNLSDLSSVSTARTNLGLGTMATQDSTSVSISGGTLASVTLTTPTISSIINTGTLTLPNQTDTLVGRATTDVLTNKTLTSPVMTTPSLGVASATSINKVAITAPATGATLTIADGATLTASATATVSGTNTGDQTISITGDVTASGSTGVLTSTVTKVNGTSLAGLATGILKNTTGTGVPSIAVSGSDYAPATSGSSILYGNSAGGFSNVTIGSGVAFSGGTLSATGTGGTVTTVSVTTANGVSGTVANPTTTPAISLTLGAITPTSVAASGTVTGSNLSGTHSGTSSGTNTGDQTITLTGGVTGSGTGSFAATVVTNANLTGDVTSVGNATTLTNAPVIAKVLTGYVSGAGTVAATDSILQAIQKLNGNDATNANLTGAITSVGNATSLGSFSSANLSAALTDETGSGAAVFATSPTLVTPILGTPQSGTLSSCTGLPISTGVSGLGTGIATFLGTPSSANLAAALTDETGSGSAVFATSPTLVSPALGTPSAIVLTNASGTASIDTNGAHNGSVGATTPAAGSFTTLSASGTITAGDLMQMANTANANRINVFSNVYGLGIDSSDLVAYANTGTGFSVKIGGAGYNSTLITRTTSTGLAVTGALSSTTGATFATSSGNVGIGTSSPAYKLQVQGAAGNILSWTDGTTPGTLYSGGGYVGLTFPAGTGGFFINTAGNFNTISTNGIERVRIDSSGNLLVGVTSSAASPANGICTANPTGGTSLNIGHASGTPDGYSYMQYAYNGSTIGYIYQNGTTAVVYSTTSDYRRKSNVKDLSGSGTFIDALKPRTFDWDTGDKGVGFIAHEFAEVSPSSVRGKKDEVDSDGKPVYQAMQASSAEVIANLVAELQSVRQRLAALESN